MRLAYMDVGQGREQDAEASFLTGILRLYATSAQAVCCREGSPNEISQVISRKAQDHHRQPVIPDV